MTPVLTLDEARQLLTLAQSSAAGLGVPMSFAVLDAGGHLIALARMDGAPWISTDVCQGKAWTAAAFGLPSHAQKEKLVSMPNFASALTTMTHGQFTPQTGGVPIYRDGVLVGAIGGSGGTGDQDEAACTAAIAAAGFAASR